MDAADCVSLPAGVICNQEIAYMNTDCIEKNVVLQAPLSRVWQAVSNSAEFGSWFGVKFPGPFVAGASMQGYIVPTTVDEEVAAMQKPYEGTPFNIVVEKIIPEELFSFRWHPYAIEPGVDYSAEEATLVEFTFVESSEGVTLTVTECGFDKIPIERRAKAFAANEGGWAHQMKLVQEYLRRAS
jgi:uncharacterized protein YndB with AHSA1/START domain